MDNNTNKKYVIHVLHMTQYSSIRYETPRDIFNKNKKFSCPQINHESQIVYEGNENTQKIFFLKNIKSYKIITHESQLVFGESDENTKIFFLYKMLETESKRNRE